jgi:zinc D-Ala-D-Ala carboxypeptidase
MQLSPNFSLVELTSSETAERHGIDNTPTSEIIENLKHLAAALQEVRTLLGNKPIHINSGYRSLAVNEKLGSKPTSDHCKGLAADFVCPSFGTPDDIVRAIMASPISYKQVIREFDRWVHLAVPAPGEEPRRQALIIDKQGTRNYA